MEMRPATVRLISKKPSAAKGTARVKSMAHSIDDCHGRIFRPGLQRAAPYLQYSPSPIEKLHHSSLVPVPKHRAFRRCLLKPFYFIRREFYVG